MKRITERRRVAVVTIFTSEDEPGVVRNRRGEIIDLEKTIADAEARVSGEQPCATEKIMVPKLDDDETPIAAIIKLALTLSNDDPPESNPIHAMAKLLRAVMTLGIYLELRRGTSAEDAPQRAADVARLGLAFVDQIDGDGWAEEARRICEAAGLAL